MTQDTSSEVQNNIQNELQKQSQKLDTIEAKQHLMEVKQAVSDQTFTTILAELKDLKQNTLREDILKQYFKENKKDRDEIKQELRDFKKNIVKIVWAPIIAFMTAVGAWFVKQWNG